MRKQERPDTCGPASIANAARALGFDLEERRVCARCPGRARGGLTERELVTAARRVGLACSPRGWHSPRRAWAWLVSQLQRGRPVVCTVDRDTHFVVILGALGRARVVVYDSAREREVRCEDGVSVVGKASWLYRWRGVLGFAGAALSKTRTKTRKRLARKLARRTRTTRASAQVNSHAARHARSAA